MRLSILDQSPIISGFTPAHAIAETIKLAQAAERLGYFRYWLAEHHSLAALADPCPEILVTRVAAATSTIRVGTGGILLPHYSALKIAEQFRMLEALFPQRIDLGIGRAPGGDRTTALAMGEGRYSEPRISRNRCNIWLRISTMRCPPVIRSRKSKRSRRGRLRPKCGCSARRTTAARWPRSSA